MNTLLYSVLFGLLFVAIGVGSKFVLRPLLSVALPSVCDNWNENYLMEGTLFLTGFLFGLLLSYETFTSLKDNRLIAAILFGVIVIGISGLSKIVTYPLLSINLPEACEGWNKNHIKEISNFITGAIVSFGYFYLNK